MSERDDILERNLQLLFTRAHRPVRPSAEFRDRLVRALERKPSAQRPTPDHASRRIPVRMLAAAAVLLVAALGYLVYRAGGGTAQTLESILARGSVAIRESTRTEWTEIDAQSARLGLDYATCVLSAATPLARVLELRFGSEGNVRVEANSRVELDVQPSRHSVALTSGSVRIENLAGRPGEPWTLGGAGSVVELERGVLRARIAPCDDAQPEVLCLIVMLESGRARASSTHELALGVECALFEDRIMSATAALEPTAASQRTSLASGTTTETEPATPSVEPDGLARITGTIERAASHPPVGEYTVTLLRKQRLPSVSTPRPYTFSGAERFVIPSVKPGTYDVFVERKGTAVWRALGVEIAAGATQDFKIVSTAGSALRGRVVDDRTGAPVENALVIVEDDLPAQVIQFDTDASTWLSAARTDSNGEFVIEHVTPIAHTLRATAPGFAATWGSSTVDAHTPVELRLGVPGTIAGSVAHDDGQPWPGAIVIASFMPKDGGFARFSYGLGIAEADGRYAISDLPAGDYVLLNVRDASPKSESVPARQVRVDAGATTIANLPETINGPRFHGRVLGHDGAPLAGLDVTLQPQGVDDDASWRSVRTAVDGRFAFAGLPSATYEVFVGESLGERFAWAEVVTLQKGGDLEHDIRLGAGAIRGRATAKEGAVAGAFVMLQRAEPGGFVFAGRALTDPRGEFTFERLHPATYRAVVFPAQKGLAPRESTDLWIARNGPEVACELTIERGAALTVVVRDASGTPLPGIALDFVDGAGHAFSFRANDVTGADGRYAIDGLAAGRWSVSARGRDGATVTRHIELSVGDERELVLTLP